MPGDLPFLDSFRHYDTSRGVQKWSSGVTIVAGIGRRGGAGARVSGAGIGRTFDAEYGTLYCGGAFKGPGNAPFVVSNALSGIQVRMLSVGDGRFVMDGQDPTAGLVTAFAGTQVTPPVLMDRWYYLEAFFEVTPTTYSVIFRINEKVVLTETYGLAGTLTSHAAWATLNIQGRGGGLTTDLDDIYVDEDEFFGDVNIDVLHTDGAGSSSMWIPTPAVANYLNVDDVIPDDGATVVASSFVSDLDLYSMEDIPSGLTVKAIQGLASVTKDNAGLAALKLQYGSGGGATLSAEFFPSAGAYIYARDGRKLLGGSAITSAVLNGLEFGQIRTQ